MHEPDLGPDSSAACTPMLVVGRTRSANPVNNRVDNTQDQAYLAAFAAAEERIRIETPNLNDDGAKAALADAGGVFEPDFDRGIPADCAAP